MQYPRQSSNDALPNSEYNFLHIYAGKLFDPISRSMQSKRLIKVNTSTGRIQDVTSFTELEAIQSDIRVLDCRKLTIVPGFVDVDVHLFQEPESGTWERLMTEEILAEKTIRAASRAKSTLMAGFTTVRDLGMLGAGDASIILRECIDQGLTPGPRYYCANKPITQYVPHLDPQRRKRRLLTCSGDPPIGEYVELTLRHIGVGVDWIKIYTEYRLMGLSDPTYTVVPSFTYSQLEAIITTARELFSPISHKPLVRIAAHATEYSTVMTLFKFGVHSIENGLDMFGCPPQESKVETIASLFQQHYATWVPTIAAAYTLVRGDSSRRGVGVHASGLDEWARAVRTFKTALPYISSDRPANTPHIRVAVGGDAGVSPNGDNALVMRLMVHLGAQWRDVLSWATIGGWGCITGEDSESIESDEEALLYLADNRGDPLFGVLRPGWAADIVGLAGDLEAAEDVEAEFARMTHRETGIRLVVKAGKVYRWEGEEPPAPTVNQEAHVEDEAEREQRNEEVITWWSWFWSFFN